LVPRSRAREGGDERLVLVEGPVRDRAVDALEVLVEHPARADRQVPDLRVAHLPRRQPDGFAGCLQRRVRIAAPERVEDRRVRELDGVAGAGRRATPAVEDDDRYERDAAVWQIAVKESTSSEAPPTSAPSTSVCASSSCALSGLTEPP
jgi:hypothetical protein